MGDGLFFTLGLVFFFIIWVASGGPTRPISFAGPFITPITNAGQTQTGYGPPISVGGTVSAGGGSVTVGEKTNTGIQNTSSYAGAVVLTHQIAGLNGTDPKQEHVEVKVLSTGPSSVDITGWKLVSTITGASATIPTAAQMLRLGPVQLQDVMLKPGNSATIDTGISPVSVSFEQNTCVNYLAQANTYNQCYANQSGNSGFLTGIWNLYLNKNTRLWKDSGETIELVDSSGKIVDSFSY